jgi:hypothetical protein
MAGKLDSGCPSLAGLSPLRSLLSDEHIGHLGASEDEALRAEKRESSVPELRNGPSEDEAPGPFRVFDEYIGHLGASKDEALKPLPSCFIDLCADHIPIDSNAYFTSLQAITSKRQLLKDFCSPRRTPALFEVLETVLFAISSRGAESIAPRSAVR